MVSTPAPPDPMQTAQAQAGLNQSTATTQQLLNMTDQVNPWGSVTYDQNGSTGFVDSTGKYNSVPKFTQTTTYNPAQQAIFDQTTAAQGNIAALAAQQSDSLKNYLNTGFDFGKGEFSPDMVSNPGNFSFSNQDAANWAYDLGSQRILPQQQQDRAALEAQLVNKGLRPGTAAWDSEMQRLGRTQSDQLNQLTLDGRGMAFNESLAGHQQNANQGLAYQQALFNQQLGSRQQQFQEAVTGRNQPLNEITALLSGSQIANPGGVSPGTPQTSVGGVDYTGLVGQNYQTQAANAGGALGGLFGLAGSLGSAGIKAGMFSDARVKTDIARVGTLDNGLPVYSYRYIWGGPTHIGVMAQDVEEFNPAAVFEVGGVKAVDYEMAVQ